MVITENTPPNLNESVIAYHKDGISYSPSLLNFVLIKRKQHIIVSGINFAPLYIYIYSRINAHEIQPTHQYKNKKNKCRYYR